MGNHKTPHISKTQKSAALDYTYDTKHGVETNKKYGHCFYCRTFDQAPVPKLLS